MNSWQCPKCGATNAPSFTLCQKCGFSTVVQPVVHIPPQDALNLKKPLTFALPLLILGFGIVCVPDLLHSRKLRLENDSIEANKQWNREARESAGKYATPEWQASPDQPIFTNLKTGEGISGSGWPLSPEMIASGQWSVSYKKLRVKLKAGDDPQKIVAAYRD